MNLPKSVTSSVVASGVGIAATFSERDSDGRRQVIARESDVGGQLLKLRRSIL
jgi:hypothetical protein